MCFLSACSSFGTASNGGADTGVADAVVPDAGTSDADAQAIDAGPSPCASPGADVVFCQDFEGPGLSSPFGFDRALPVGVAPPSLVVDGTTKAIEVRYGDGVDLNRAPGVVLRKLVLADFGYELSFRFEVVEHDCSYAVLGGLFSTFAAEDSGGVTAGPTLCDDGSTLSGKDCAPSQPLKPGWHSSKTIVSAPQPGLGRRVQLSIDGLPNVGKDLPADPTGARTALALLIGPHYPSTQTGCRSVVVRYDDIVLRRTN